MKKKPIKLTGKETPEERAAINRQIQKDQHEMDRRSQEKGRATIAKQNAKKAKREKHRNRNNKTGEEKRRGYSVIQHKLIAEMKDKEMSYMEKRVASILDKYGVGYRHNHRIKDLFLNGKAKLLFYDFFIPHKNAAIEYDGSQHFRNKDKEALAKSVDNDLLKNMVSKDRHIKLLRLSSIDIPKMESIIKKFLGY